MQGDELRPLTNVSIVKTCFNGLNALSGVGILSISYAISEGGWLSVLFLFLIAVVCFYTGLLLQRCIDSNILVKTYPDIGELAFGHKGRIIVATFIYLELYLTAIAFLIMEGDNLEKLFPNTSFRVLYVHISGKHAFVLLAAAIVLPTIWLKRLGVLAYVSLGGILASLVLLVCVLWAGIFAVGFPEKGTLIKWNGIPTATSLYVFCYGGHAVFPTIYTSMEKRAIFPRVLFICFLLSTLIYGLMGIFGYMMFGSDVKSQITLNLPPQMLSSKLAIYTTLINPLTKYALYTTPIAFAIEEQFKASNYRFCSILIRTLLVVSTVVVSLMVPFFGYLMALTGSFLSTTVSLLLPCICYQKIFEDARRWSIELAVIIVIVLMGFFIVVVGTFESTKLIISNLCALYK